MTRTRTKVDSFCTESPNGVHQPVIHEREVTIKGRRVLSRHTNCKACRLQLSKEVQ